MVGLMTLWFGPFVDMRPDTGYFHLCPACYRRHIKPHVDRVQGRLAELHPLARHLGLCTDLMDEDSRPDGAPTGRTRTDEAPAAIPAGGGAVRE
jgi:hypothetical protein